MQSRVVLATLVGAVVLFATGYVIFDVMVAEFYNANAGSATGVTRSPQVVWAVVLGAVAYAILITFAIGNRAEDVTVARGATVGAIVGFLLWFTADFVLYGITNIANLTRTIVDPVLEGIHGGIGGAAVAAVLGRVGVRRSSPARV